MSEVNGSTRKAVATLHARGAHMVVLGPDEEGKLKKPVLSDWQSKPAILRAALSTYDREDRALGLMPGSLGLTVCDPDVPKDVDDRQERRAIAERLLAAVIEWAGDTPLKVRTQSGGYHVYYRADDPERGKVTPRGILPGNRALEIFGCTGQVVLYDPEGLAAALDDLPVLSGVIPAQANGHAGGGMPGGRGRSKGDRNSGGFIRARMAMENDASVSQVAASAVSAVRDRMAAGDSMEEALDSTVRGLVYGRETRREHEPEPEPLPEKPPTPEDVQAVLAQWMEGRGEVDMPHPRVPMPPMGERPHRVEEPVDAWGLSQAWAHGPGKGYRCAMTRSGRPTWYRYTKEAGWEMVSVPYVINAIKVYARGHFYRYDKTSGGNVQDPFGGVTNTIAKPTEEGARSLQGVAIHASAMDADPFVTGLPCGEVVDARDKSVVVGGPAYLVTKSAAGRAGEWKGSQWEATVDFHVPCPLERMYFGCYLGRAFLGGRDRVGLFLPGAKHAGKTTVVEAVRHAFGDYGMSASAKLLMPTGKADFTQDSMRAQLRGRRLVTIAEADEGARLDAYAIKGMISDDQVQGRMKDMDTVSFDPTWSILFHMNDFPEMDYRDDAAWSRVAVLPFNTTRPAAERKSAFTRVLQQPKEVEAIIGWLLHHGWLWKEHGMPPQSQSMLDARRKEMEASVPPIVKFIRYAAVKAPECKMLFADFNAAFVDWCRRQGYALPRSDKEVAKTLRGCQDIEVSRGTGNQVIVRGLRLR